MAEFDWTVKHCLHLQLINTRLLDQLDHFPDLDAVLEFFPGLQRVDELVEASNVALLNGAAFELPHLIHEDLDGQLEELNVVLDVLQYGHG